MAHHSFRVVVPKGEISDDVKSMLGSEEFGDAVVEAEGKKFFVYRGMLQTRSSVFAGMFDHQFQEREQNRIVIEDVKHEVVQEMLIYIYTDTAPNLKEMAQDLLVIAEKYNLQRLKVMCEA